MLTLAAAAPCSYTINPFCGSLRSPLSLRSSQKDDLKQIAAGKSNKRAIISIVGTQLNVNVVTDDPTVNVKKASMVHAAVQDHRYLKLLNLGEQTLDESQSIRFKGKTLEDASLGPLMLHQLQEGRRKDSCIIVRAGKGKREVKFKIPTALSTLTFLDSHEKSYLTDNSKVIANFAMFGKAVHAVAVTRLDMLSGRSKAEGITLLPSDEWFAQKAFLTFGLDLVGSMWTEEGGTDDILQECEQFNEACQGLGENLVCVPGIVRRLCKIFGVEEWDLRDNACIGQEETVDEDLEEVIQSHPSEGW